ncbi:MAG: transglutaminase domain-containing protein [Nitrospirae bacterium]|nr:transglutaminase domain-containing protein [Nitrospirota bacterium]
MEKKEIIEEAFSKTSDWYDIYNGTNKLGFAVTTFEKAGDEIIITENKELKVFKNGKETLLTEEVRLLTDNDYKIRSADYSSVFKGEEGIRASGSFEDDAIIFILESAKHRKTHKIEINKKSFYHFLTLIPLLNQNMPVPGSPFKVLMLDLANLSINDVKVVLEEIRPVKIGTNVFNLYKFRAGDTILWINEQGALIKKEYPSGTTFYSELESIAKESDDRVFLDYTSLPVLKSNKLIANPEDLNLLRVKIKDYNFQSKLYEKTLAKLKGDTLIIRREAVEELKKKKYIFPYKEKDFNEYLSPDRWVLTDYEPLAYTGRLYAKLHKYDGFSFAEYLNSYLYGLIRTMPEFVLRNSTEIQKYRYGDYIERSIMFATYARTAGLPTRLIGGIVYRNGYFYFHVWPEVWLDRWIPADPSLEQFPADATHIPLKEGTLEDIVSIINDLKKIEIEVLEAS